MEAAEVEQSKTNKQIQSQYNWKRKKKIKKNIEKDQIIESPPPKKKKKKKKKVPKLGIEPLTSGLIVYRSTNWAILGDRLKHKIWAGTSTRWFHT